MPVTLQPTTLKYKDGQTFVSADCLKGDPGSPGDPTQLIDDTAGSGDTDKTWSADKLTSKADTANPNFTGSISMGRVANTTVGEKSTATGNLVTASGPNSNAEGYGTTASGNSTHAEGNQTFAVGDYSHSQGYGTRANGDASSAEGNGTVANGANSSVSGMHNVPDSYANWPDWAPNTYYAAGAKVHFQDEESGDPRGEYFVCNTSHTSGTAWITYSFYWDSDNGKMNYAQIVGNGSNYLQQSNAYTLDWDGNGSYAGDVTINKGTAEEVSVSELKTEINSIDEEIFTDVPSKNLYDKNSCNPQDGKVYKTTGTQLQDNSSYAVTGKIPVDANTQYIFSAGEARIKYVMFLSGETGGTRIEEATYSGAFTTPANCTFVDFELFAGSHTTEQFNAAINAAQLERGDTISPYEPYGTVRKFSLPAETTDEGKALSPKTVSNGKVTEWQYVEVGGGSSVTVDDDFSDSSTNPVQNKVITKVVEDVTDKHVSPNLYDKTTCNPQNGKVYKATGTQLQDSANYAVTGKVPVEAETQYIFYAGGKKIKYVMFLSGESGGTRIREDSYDGAFTTPANCTFVDFELFAASHTTDDYNDAINGAMLVKGSVIPETYQPYGEVTYTVPTEALDDAEAVEGARNYTVKKSLINLYDKSLAVDNKVFNTNKLVDNTSYAFSGLIPVEPNTQYCFSIQKGLEYGYISAWYQRWDSTGAFIDEVEGVQSTSHTNQMQTTATTAFVSFCIYFGAAHTTEAFNNAIDTLMVVEGCQRPLEYVPYNLEPVVNHLKFDTMYRDNADRFRGKRWIAFGTSVTYQDSKAYTEGVANGEVVRGYVGDIARRKPMIVRNSGVSGSTLAGSDTSALINRYQNYTYTDWDFVTIEYGINDFGNDVPVGTASDAAGTSTFAACLKTIIEYILNENPIIGLIICTDPDVRGATQNNNGNRLKDYADVMLEIAAQYRLPVCDWFYHSGINSITKGDGSSRYFLTQAGTHPSVYGHMRMGAMLNQVFDSLLC